MIYNVISLDIILFQILRITFCSYLLTINYTMFA